MPPSIEHAVGAGDLVVAWGFAVATILLAVGGRRRFPAGVVAGLLTAGVSGVILLVMLVSGPAVFGWDTPQPRDWAIRHWVTAHDTIRHWVMLALAVAYYACGAWLPRTSPGALPTPHPSSEASGDEAISPSSGEGPGGGSNRSAPGPPQRGASPAGTAIGSGFLLHAATLAVLLAIAFLPIASAEGSPRDEVILWCVLSLGVLLHLRRGGGIITRAAAWTACIMLAGHVRHAGGGAPNRWLAFGGACALLLAVVVDVLVAWRRRVRDWRVAVECAVERPRRRGGLILGCLFAAALAAATIVGPPGGAAPVTLALAGIAVLIIGHRECSNAAGELGLLLIVGGVAISPTAWLQASPACGLLGTSVAALYMSWLGRFWSQQLHDGRPWTTTGRLVPVARGLSAGLAGVELIFAVRLATVAGHAAADWTGVIATGLTLIHGLVLVRATREATAAETAAAGCIAMIAAALAAFAVAASPEVITLAIVVAAAGAIIARHGAATPEARWVFDAYVGALVPATTLAAVVLTWRHGGLSASTVVALGIVAGTVLLRWGGRAADPHTGIAARH